MGRCRKKRIVRRLSDKSDREGREGVGGRQKIEIEKMVDGIERPSGEGDRDKVGWLCLVTEEDQKKPVE